LYYKKCKDFHFGSVYVSTYDNKLDLNLKSGVYETYLSPDLLSTKWLPFVALKQHNGQYHRLQDKHII